MYSALYIPSYDDMLRTGNSIMADAVRSRKGGILSLLDLWDGPRLVIEGSVKDVSDILTPVELLTPQPQCMLALRPNPGNPWREMLVPASWRPNSPTPLTRALESGTGKA